MSSNLSLNGSDTEASPGSLEASFDGLPLLPTCVCGTTYSGRRKTINECEIVMCTCGIARQWTYQTEAEYEAQYADEYHKSRTRHPGCVPYSERYAHDFTVAGKRIAAYKRALGPGHWRQIKNALDVGAGNGAFVDRLAGEGIDAGGLELNAELCTNRVHFGHSANELDDRYDLVTYHDVIEHIVDPVAELATAKRILKPFRYLIVDLPNVFVGAGMHHIKPEHLWYFDNRGFERLLKAAGFTVMSVLVPIPGKMVFYARS